MSSPAAWKAGPADLSIAEASRLIETGALSPVEVLQACIARIDADDARLHCFITLMLEQAGMEARAAEERARAGERLGPLDGIPIAVKDILASAGVRTTAGSRILADFVPGRDASALLALRRAGAVIVGKTNLHELAYGVTSANPYYGSVINPLDPERLVGGSSGGSAAAVASRMALGAIGSDTGGSIRIPAAACGLYGLKPTFGLIDCRGAIPQSWSLDHLGPLARSIEDLELMMTPWLAPGPAGRELERELRIGVPIELIDLADPVVQSAFEGVLDRLRAGGAEIVKVNIPGLAEAKRAWLTILLAESAAYHRKTLEEAPYLIGEDVRPFVLAGLLVDAASYLEAQRVRAEWVGRVGATMNDLDVLAHPTLPVAVPKREEVEIGLGDGGISVRDAMVLFQWPANLLGWPALALPCREQLEGLPFSLMVTGKPGSDRTLLSHMQHLSERAGL